FLTEATRREAAATTDREKARAAYSRARLLFHQRHLVLYNDALWQGERIYAFDIQSSHGVLSRAYEGAADVPADSERRACERYHEEHTALYQALRGFERIAHHYPQTREAPKSLYSAALCYTLLSSLDSYWSSRKINYDG